jgi:hypothetical protein
VLPCVASSWVLVGLSHPERSFKTVQFQGSRSAAVTSNPNPSSTAPSVLAPNNETANKFYQVLLGLFGLIAGEQIEQHYQDANQ